MKPRPKFIYAAKRDEEKVATTPTALADRILTERGVFALIAVALMGWVLWMFTTVISEMADTDKEQVEILRELKDIDEKSIEIQKQRLETRKQQVTATENLANALEKIFTEKR